MSWWRSMRGMVVGRAGVMRMGWLRSGVIAVVCTAHSVIVAVRMSVRVADGVIVVVRRTTRAVIVAVKLVAVAAVVVLVLLGVLLVRSSCKGCRRRGRRI
jgi:hypothetical protein